MRNKSIYLIAFILLNAVVCFAQTPKNAELAEKINQLYELDQKVQTDIISAINNRKGKEEIGELEKTKDATFKNHISILKEIIKKHGVVTFDLVGKKSSDNFFILVQHSDSDVKFQKCYLKKAKKYVKRKQLSASLFAYLTDRVNINSGKPQIYGTQLKYDTPGVPSPKKIKDPKNVNKRRAAVGLEPIEEYLKSMIELLKKMRKEPVKT